MTAVAKVKVLKGRKTPNGNEAIYSLRMGESGTGKEIGRATFWPWSVKSQEAAGRTIEKIAEMKKVKIVWPPLSDD